MRLPASSSSSRNSNDNDNNNNAPTRQRRRRIHRHHRLLPSLLVSTLILVVAINLGRGVSAWTMVGQPSLSSSSSSTLVRQSCNHHHHHSRSRSRRRQSQPPTSRLPQLCGSSSSSDANGGKEEEDDGNDKTIKGGGGLDPADELASLPEPPSKHQQQQPKLGIDIGAMLDPLTDKEAAELMAAAQEVVNDAIAVGLDAIEALRWEMKVEGQQQAYSLSSAKPSYLYSRRTTTRQQQHRATSRLQQLYASGSDTNGGKEDDEDNKTKNKGGGLDPADELASLPAPPSKQQQQQPKLGIDIGAMLDPLTDKEAAELKAAAQEVVNDAIAAGLDDIEALRRQMKVELEETRAQLQARSAQTAEREQTKLLAKIDALTDAFLQSNRAARESTKTAAAADRANAGRGLEVGVWGTASGGAAVTTDAALLGSVASATATTAATFDETTTETTPQEEKNSNRILVLGDPDSDPYAQRLVPAITEALSKVLEVDGNDDDDSDALDVKLCKPTAAVPLGGGDAAAVVLFCTSFTDRAAVATALDRCLRRTVSGSDGRIGRPPTHLVAVSTVGTERTDRMPYSMQNWLGGGKLERRRQMEECVVRTVRDRTATPALDYTICKFGELKDGGKTSQNDAAAAFNLQPGDVLDGTVDPATAATVLTQALALQPAARNATFCCVGQLAPDGANSVSKHQQAVLDDAFLRLDGPELARIDLEGATEAANFGQLVEYLREWAQLLAESGQGLTTPIRANEVASQSALPPTVQRQQAAVQLLFVPTNTGRNYVSKAEERARENERGSGSSSGSSSSSATAAAPRRSQQEGGVEFVVEVTAGDRLRVRAKRCNYGDDAVVKELSEETILSRFRKCMEVWQKDHQQQ